MWSVMSFATRFQQGIDQLRNDTQALVQDVMRFFRGLPDETILLMFVMFILGLFYLIVRQPKSVKKSGDWGRQFVYALAIVIIFGTGISWVMEHNGMDKITRVASHI